MIMAQAETSLASMAASLLERDAEERKALALLLDRYITIKNKILVQKAEMGGTESYVGAVTLEWFAERVRFASQLPLFKEKLDPKTRKVLIDKETIDEILQRPIDYTRKATLAQYLAARRRHKFPPVLVVVSQDWVDNSTSDEWDSQGQAIRSSTEFTPLDSSGGVGLLDVSETMSIFALDGQHRLLGVQGLMELIKTGSLQVLNKDGQPKPNATITVDDLSQYYGVRAADLQRLGKELIGIEFISAVVPGETRDHAKRRVRSIFVHVNRMASPLSLGQIHQLDEDSGFALVAKRVATHHPFLEPKERVNWESNTIVVRSASFTTLQALTEMARGYLRPKHQTWEPAGEKDLIPQRPSDADLSQGTDDFTVFMNKIVELPSVKKVVQGASAASLRNFSHETPAGEGNILFRPVGQEVLANAVGSVVFDQEKQRSLDTVFTKLTTFDKKGGFSNINEKTSIWYGVLVDQKKKRIVVAGKRLAIRLLAYMLSGGIENEEEREALRRDFALARTLDGEATNLKGKTVKPEDIELPDPL
jgi:DGQHR domain-containing protein